MDGHGRLHLDAPEVFKACVRALAHRAVEVIVRVQRRHPSTSARGYWHGVVVPIIANEMGHAPWEHDAVHDFLVMHLLGPKNPGEKFPVRHSTANGHMDQEQYGQLIELAQLFAAQEFGRVIPDPDKAWRTRPVVA